MHPYCGRVSSGHGIASERRWKPAIDINLRWLSIFIPLMICCFGKYAHRPSLAPDCVCSCLHPKLQCISTWWNPSSANEHQWSSITTNWRRKSCQWASVSGKILSPSTLRTYSISWMQTVPSSPQNSPLRNHNATLQKPFYASAKWPKDQELAHPYWQLPQFATYTLTSNYPPSTLPKCSQSQTPVNTRFSTEENVITYW